MLAVELHPARAAALRDRFAGSGVAVLELDTAAFRWPGHPFRVVANPPYAGVNALVRRLIRRYGDRLELGARVPPHAFRNRPPGGARVLRIR